LTQDEDNLMKKRMLIMLIIVGLLFTGIFGFQIFKGIMIKKYLSSNKAPAITVSAAKVESQEWQKTLFTVGNTRAVQGVDITAEAAGLVRKIYFNSGDDVQKDQLLVQLNADADIGSLHSLQAAAELSTITYKRDKEQLKDKAISQAIVDADAADLKGKKAQVKQQTAIVEQKSIRAPFTGKLGITMVNPGQYLNPGDKVVTLQTLDSVYIDFNLPQQQISQIKLGQKVKVNSDSYPERVFNGTITAINPLIDTSTRNFQVESTVKNGQKELIPGMFVNVSVDTGAAQKFLTVPQTAISFNPYGSTVYIVEEVNGDDGRATLKVKQVFVNTGETRGDQVAITSGIKEGDMIVTSGQLKLRNGSEVAINNKVQPSNNAAPKLTDQ